MIAVAGQAMFHLGHKKCFVYGGDGDYTPIQRIDVGAATLGATAVTSVASNSVGERSLRSDNTSSLVPVGALVLFPFKSPPEGYLIADGSDLSRQTYGSLFGRIGTTFGSGDGINTFSLPDYRGVVFRGYDAGRGVDVDRNMFLEQPGSAMVTVPLSTVTGPTGVNFTTPGGPYTWTVPANVTSISIFVIGGGGGGSGSYYYWGGGSGGGAGGYVLAMLNVTPGQQLTINVGAGGAGSTTLGVGAVDGGNTTVTTAGVSIIGYGGKASYWNQAGAGGGKSASGVTVVKSGNGNAGQIGSWPYNSGTGGSSYYTTLFGTSTAGAGYVGDGNHATGGLGSYGGGGGGGSWYGYGYYGYNYGYGYGYYGGWGDGSWYYWDWGLSAGGSGGNGLVAISYTPSVNSISAGAGPIYGIFSIGSTPELTMRNAALLPCIKY
jgi:microcystin-dependent protein